MPLEAPYPGSPAEWIRFAKADLSLAQGPLPEGALLELLCFHAQQAAEKSIKAVLIHCGVEFPKTHILARLVDLVPVAARTDPALAEAARLTVYATVARYPGLEEPVTETEYREAVRIADVLVRWAKKVATTKS